jgi:hypothetical protein
MKQTFERYCQQLSAEAEQLAQEVEMRERLEHISAFNLSRAVQRLGDAQQDLSAQAGLCVRARWLLIGIAIGAAFAAVFVQIWQLNH